MLCYITHDMLCYITHDMLCYITHVMLCYITHVMLCYVIAAGHQPAADHILERFEIFGSMVRWFNGSMVQSASA